MKMIQLTEAERGDPVLINIDHITCVGLDLEADTTWIVCSGCPEAMQVKESFMQIRYFMDVVN